MDPYGDLNSKQNTRLLSSTWQALNVCERLVLEREMSIRDERENTFVRFDLDEDTDDDTPNRRRLLSNIQRAVRLLDLDCAEEQETPPLTCKQALNVCERLVQEREMSIRNGLN